ncbi:uncharacterized protein LOC115717978 [Cannabis sativa]|uniref:uncharacterized protein LOC115717978 n=1 Tax=Cannabis sativa TaxID=3483 RepID=UPI0029CA8830|nr:uncharacterized protein LOC115717978 [Cannabis sativa]
MGDLNNTLSHEDKLGENPYPEWLLQGFHKAISDCNLINFDLSGYQYTWERGKGTANWIEVRLDRALTTQSLMDLFNDAKLFNLKLSSSDHYPILMEPLHKSFVPFVRKFRFENTWLRVPMCMKIIKDSWESCNELDIQQKIINYSEILQVWEKDYTSNFKDRIKEYKAEINRLKKERDEASLSKFKEAKKKLFEVFTQRENGKNSSMALKLDMSKAYDRLEWSFLRAVLQRIAFSDTWIKLLMTCVSTVFYKFVRGGREIGPLIPSRDIRQGDPLLPYLFIICAEGLSSLLHRYEMNGSIRGCKVARGAPVVSHMLFVDDSYVYCKATKQEASNVLSLLRVFEGASSQQVNFAKSFSFFSSNTEASFRTRICGLLGIEEVGENSSYLGLPNTIGRKKTTTLGFLSDRLKKRIQGWEGKILFRANKEVLLKTIAQSLPNYAMRIFLLPLDTCKELERLMARFGWQSDSSKQKGIHWMSWSRLSRHKHVGGLGFCNLHDFNLALLGKQGWQLLTQSNSLAGKVFKARYYPQSSFLLATLGDNPSFVWRSIFESQQPLQAGIRRSIGGGSEAFILNETWWPDNEHPYVISNHPGLINKVVSSLFQFNDRAWDAKILQDLFDTRDREVILNIQLSSTATHDEWYWKKETSVVYSVRSAYRFLQELKGSWSLDNNAGFWRKQWNLKIPPKARNFLWRAISNCLPTRTQLCTKHVELVNVCPMCNAFAQSNFHVLVGCTFARSCWPRSSISVEVLLQVLEIGGPT